MREQPELELVGDVGGEDVLGAIALLDPDVVALGREDGAEFEIALFQRLHPHLRIVAIDADGTAIEHQPGEPPRRVSNISPTELFDMLRTGSARPGARPGRSQ